MKIYDLGATILIAIIVTCAIGAVTSAYFKGLSRKTHCLVKEINEKSRDVKSNSTSLEEIKEKKTYPVEFSDQLVPDIKRSSDYQIPIEDFSLFVPNKPT